MSSKIVLFNQFPELLSEGLVVWDTDTLKLALVSSSYTYSPEHTQWADASGYEVTGTNYTTGGVTLSNASTSRSAGVTTLDADDVPFVGLAATFRNGIIYKSGTAGSLTNPLLAMVRFSYDAETDVSSDVVATVGFPITWNADGIIVLNV